MSTLDPTTAEENLEAALGRVSSSANAQALSASWLDVVHQTANELPLFTTDDVRVRGAELGVQEFDEPRALGSVMRAAAAEGWIVATPLVRASDRPQSNRANLRVWLSTIVPDALSVEPCEACGGTGHRVVQAKPKSVWDELQASFEFEPVAVDPDPTPPGGIGRPEAVKRGLGTEIQS